MELAYTKLNEEQVQKALSDLPGWTIQNDKLTRTYTFETYKEGIDFAVSVGNAADVLNHHPDIHIGYCRVKVAVNTHDVNGISPYDFELARRVDAIA